MFNKLILISLTLYLAILLFGIMFKSMMPNDLIANYEFLSSMTIEERLDRGLKIFEFYKIEYELGIIKRTIILDVLNMIVFVPLGILLTHFFNKNRVFKSTIVVFLIALFIELFQLTTIIGAFMLNDLIINVIGGLIGASIYVIVIKSKNYKVYNILLLIFSFIILAILMYLLIIFFKHIDVYIDIVFRKI